MLINNLLESKRILQDFLADLEVWGKYVRHGRENGSSSSKYIHVYAC